MFSFLSPLSVGVALGLPFNSHFICHNGSAGSSSTVLSRIPGDRGSLPNIAHYGVCFVDVCGGWKQRINNILLNSGHLLICVSGITVILRVWQEILWLPCLCAHLGQLTWDGKTTSRCVWCPKQQRHCCPPGSTASCCMWPYFNTQRYITSLTDSRSAMILSTSP